ncbi:hypothetical protein QBC38DRAFT_445339 [Podospora fimiseda]|uniref:Uncharacterized protein n=1 Tax=Podospora fimiseda TaxID=252190 RepID=A0AAN7BLR6_9PEZI|nr:hypothetical protein QBC38DRAFT_445339 [Podospora fimiseda]
MKTLKDVEDAEEVLCLTAFKHIKEASEGAQKLFGHIRDRIQKAKETIPQLKRIQAGQGGPSGVVGGGVPPAQNPSQAGTQGQQPPTGAELALSEQNKSILLSREEVIRMEEDVEVRKLELWMRYTAFEYFLNGKFQEKQNEELQSVKGVIKNAWKELKRISLPDPARLVSTYSGWTFRKSWPSPLDRNYAAGETTSFHKPSWRFAVPIRIPFSTEELFLRVLAQVTRRAKSDQTLLDEHLSVLKKQSQKTLVSGLLVWQNNQLQRDYPQLEWTIAGIELSSSPFNLVKKAWTDSNTTHGKMKTKSKRTAEFDVILKTQWRFPPLLPPPRRTFPEPLPPGVRIVNHAYEVPLDRYPPFGAPPTHIPVVPLESTRILRPPQYREQSRTSAPIIINVAEQEGVRDTATARTAHRKAKQTLTPPTIYDPQFIFVDAGSRKDKKTNRKKKKVYIELRQPGSRRQPPSHPNSEAGHNRPPLPPSPPAYHQASKTFGHSSYAQPPPMVAPNQPSSQYIYPDIHEHISSETQEDDPEELAEELLDEFAEIQPESTQTRYRTSTIESERQSRSRELMRQVEEASFYRMRTEREQMRIRVNQTIRQIQRERSAPEIRVERRSEYERLLQPAPEVDTDCKATNELYIACVRNQIPREVHLDSRPQYERPPEPRVHVRERDWGHEIHQTRSAGVGPSVRRSGEPLSSSRMRSHTTK